ncbi:FecR family protein [Sphingobacterium faecale]|uniref:FecR domain-containing protein n=1 Tax=Sphingobacterium faecale TaxID=2803775 RepID=A0ABS1R5Q4_9SPHI|nr:FecR family protein [Sphingobacterium faecale]MBL1410041.1 FecR domain-containing protein [Sphingobacterium faecale]
MSKRKKDMSILFKKLLNDTHSKNDFDDILAKVTKDQNDIENQEIALLIRNVFEKNEESKLPKSEVDRIGLNTKSKLRNIIHQTGEVSLPQRSRIKRLRKNFILKWGAVAAIFTCVGIWGLIKYTSSVTDNILAEEKTVDKNELRDKKTEKITLTLANGKSVVLNDTQDGIIIGDEIKYSDGTSLNEIDEKIKKSDVLTLKIPNGMTYKIVLSDKSEVWLNAGSELNYPVKFSSKNRAVQLQGEAFFKVTENKNSPFTVKTKGQDITVLGTEFNVVEYKNNIVTSLLSGTVKVETSNGKIQKLVPGQQSSLNVENGQLDVKNVDVNLISAWREGYFVIEEKTLEEIMDMLSEWYGVGYQIGNNISKTKKYRGLIPRYNLSHTIEKLGLLSKLTITMKENKITVQK